MAWDPDEDKPKPCYICEKRTTGYLRFSEGDQVKLVVCVECRGLEALVGDTTLLLFGHQWSFW